MEREKLNEATRIAWRKYDYPKVYQGDVFKDGFKQGAEWLMAQPLIERLSDGEMENIRKLNSIIESMFDMLPEGHVNQRRVIQVEDMLIKIFGKEMFEK